jgi:prolyl-tRNA synthetase
MTHGDNSGLVLPPKVAPVQLVIVPIAMHKEGVLERANALLTQLREAGIRAKLDDSDQSPGWKFAEYEMKGVPLRLEMGPRDIEANQCILVPRAGGEKTVVSLDDLAPQVEAVLASVQQGLFDRAKAHLEANIFTAQTAKEAGEIVQTTGGFVKAMWCGATACEEALKTEYAITSRNIPFQQARVGDTCLVCGKPAETMVLWGLAY